MMKLHAMAELTDERRIYNYRHSRARRISENLFGIVANHWRLFRGTFTLHPKDAEYITIATLVIHNFLRQGTSQKIYCPPGFADAGNENGNFVPGMWRESSPTESFLPLTVPST